jgi:hypothetical protein
MFKLCSRHGEGARHSRGARPALSAPVEHRATWPAPLAGALRFELVSEIAPSRARPSSAKAKRARRDMRPELGSHMRGELVVGPRNVKRVACRRPRGGETHVYARP